MPHKPASSALKKYTVLDLTRVRAGPTCVRQLADWGADVIKIEIPDKLAGSNQMGGSREGSDFQNMAMLEEDQGVFPIFTKYFNIRQLSIPTQEPLANELESFVCSVRDQTEPVVTGQHGLQAIDIAMRITNEIHLNRANFLRCREAFEPGRATRLQSDRQE